MTNNDSSDLYMNPAETVMNICSGLYDLDMNRPSPWPTLPSTVHNFFVCEISILMLCFLFKSYITF